MIIKVVGINEFSYTKNDKEHTIKEIHFVRKPFASERNCSGLVSGSRRFFDEQCNVVANVVPNKSYTLTEEQTGTFNGSPRYEVVSCEEVKEEK